MSGTQNVVVYRITLANGMIASSVMVPSYRGYDQGDEFENALMLLVRAAYRMGKYLEGNYNGRPGVIVALSRELQTIEGFSE